MSYLLAFAWVLSLTTNIVYIVEGEWMFLGLNAIITCGLLGTTLKHVLTQ